MSFQLQFQEFLNRDHSSSDDSMSEEENGLQMDYVDSCVRLARRCEEIKADNQRLIHNIYKMKKLTKKLTTHKKLLMKRLDKHKDNYRNSDFPLFLENDTAIAKTPEEVRPKSSFVKSNSSSTSIGSKNKKSKPNTNRNESSVLTANGTICVAPKKPINPYLLFCQENRSALQEKYQMKHNTEMTHQELTKALAQQWHELSLTAKQVYYNLFNNEKVRYENEMKLFTANNIKDSMGEPCD